MTSSTAVSVLIPTPLRRFTDGAAKIELEGANVGAVLDALEREHPGIGERLRDESGNIRRFVNVFVNGKNVRDAEGLETSVAPGDEIGIIPAMAGGRGH